MDEKRIANAIGLSMKAGRCRSGDFVAERILRARGASLVLLDKQASEATRERYTHLCNLNQTPMLSIPSLGEAIGKPGRIVAVITDQGFTDMIMRAAAVCAAQDVSVFNTNERGHEQNG